MTPFGRRRDVARSPKEGADPALAEADRRWQRLLRADPRSEAALTHLAGNRLLERDDAGAAVCIDRLRAAGPLERPVRLRELEARLAERGADPDLAVRAWRRYAADGGDAVTAQFAIARLALQSRDPEAALAALAALPSDARGDEQARVLGARAHVQALDWGAALAALGDPAGYRRRRDAAVDLTIRCLLADERIEGLRAVLDAPDNAAVPLRDYFLGRADFAENRPAEALERFARSVELGAHPESRVWLVRALCALGRADEAEATVERLVAADPSDHALAARCWTAAGRLGHAARAHRRCATATDTPEAWHALARFHFGYRDWGAAWLAVLEARRAGRALAPIEALADEIAAGARALGVRLPRTVHGARRFALRSSERLVDALVARLEGSRPPPEPLPRIGRRTIALVISSLGPGGAERQVVNLANGLVERHPRDRVVLLCTHLGRAERDRFYLDQVDPRVETIEYHRRERRIDPRDVEALRPHADLVEHLQPESRRRKIVDLAVALEALDADVVHGWLDETFVNTVLVGRMLGVPSIVGRWGSMPPGVDRTVTEQSRNNIDYLQSAYRSIARLPGLVYSSNSRLTADAYAALLGVPPGDVNVVYNGIDERGLAAHASACEDPRESLGIPADARVVGTIFRMSEEKRPLLWVDVAAALERRHPDWHFVIVGAGPMEDEVRAHARDAGLRHLHFAGKRREVGAWFGAFDAMLLTSRVEGVSNAVVESQMCACPVVAPDVGGMSEAMVDGTSGRLLDASAGTEDFARAVEALLTDDEVRRATGESAREFARGKFGIDSMVANYRRVFGIRDAGTGDGRPEPVDAVRSTDARSRAA